LFLLLYLSLPITTHPRESTLFPYTTLFRSEQTAKIAVLVSGGGTNLQALIDAQSQGVLKSGKIALVISNHRDAYALTRAENAGIDRKSTRLNSSHVSISYAVFCLKKKRHKV